VRAEPVAIALDAAAPPRAVSRVPVLGAAVLAAALLAIAHLVVDPPLLLAERFVRGAGWLEIGLLAGYAAWLAAALQRPGAWARLRARVWLLFSAVFFGQLLLGLAGVEQCLMTGKLHVPVPALVAAGPVYRGEGFFMPILLGCTLLLVGPAWCSWLCYVGAWDNALARRRVARRALPPRTREALRLGLLVVAIAVAWLLRIAGVGAATAAALAGVLGLAGVGVMAAVSARRGWMAHCTSFCPLGWLVVRLGRISPFRLRIAPDCRRCGACRADCRYGALDAEAWRRREPQRSCTLCGDCVEGCGDLSIGFPGLSPRAARHLLIALVVALHAVFLGVARI
jgi:polyferredoxin